MSEIDKMYESRHEIDRNVYHIRKATEAVEETIHMEVFRFIVESEESMRSLSGHVYNYCTSEGNEYYRIGKKNPYYPITIPATIPESELNKIKQKGFDKAKELEVADIKIDFVHPEKEEGFWIWKTKVVNTSIYYIQISMTLKRR